jgi:hypothetical protein
LLHNRSVSMKSSIVSLLSGVNYYSRSATIISPGQRQLPLARRAGLGYVTTLRDVTAFSRR